MNPPLTRAHLHGDAHSVSTVASWKHSNQLRMASPCSHRHFRKVAAVPEVFALLSVCWVHFLSKCGWSFWRLLSEEDGMWWNRRSDQMRRKQKFCLGDSFLRGGDMEESCQGTMGCSHSSAVRWRWSAEHIYTSPWQQALWLGANRQNCCSTWDWDDTN